MYYEQVILGAELADELVRAGFELLRIEQGKYANYYYFVDTVELDNYLFELLKQGLTFQKFSIMILENLLMQLNRQSNAFVMRRLCVQVTSLAPKGVLMFQDALFLSIFIKKKLQSTLVINRLNQQEISR